MSALSTFKRRIWQWRAVIAIIPSVTLGVIGLRTLGLLQLGEWLAYDGFMQWRPSETIEQSVVVVGIDERDIQTVGQGQLPDGIIAQAIRTINEQQPAAIGLDIYRDLPIEPGHAALEDVFRNTPNLVGIRKVVGQEGLDTVAPPPTLAAQNQVGANDLVVDPDNTVRRGFLSVTDAEDATVYGLSFFLALHYLDQQGLAPNVDEESGAWSLGEASFPALAPDDGGYVRADTAGHQFLINYFGPSLTFEPVSLTDVLEKRLPPDWAKGKVVLIGKIGESFQDRFYVPYSRQLLDFSVPMSGVEIHAHQTEQIIQSALSSRPQFQFWSESWEWSLIALAALSGGVLAGIKPPKWKGVRGGLSLGAIASLLGGTYLAFLGGWWIPVLPALISLLGAAGGVTAWKARSAGGIRKTFGRYLSDDIVSTLLEDPDGLKLGGDRRLITILTSDLRGFTATAERLPPEDVIKILNFYLGRMAEIITEFQGTIDEFMGDGILVLFGAPIQREDDPQRAIACAISMQLAMTQINQQMQSWGYLPLEMGIGVHTGEVVVGNIGSEQRAKYGVVGSQVNLTYRIESYTTGGQILISEATRSRIADQLEIRNSQTVQPKGVAQPIQIFEVGGMGPPFQLSLPHVAPTFMQLSQPLTVRIQTLNGKDVGDDLGEGTIHQLSEQRGKITLTNTNIQQLEALMNIRFQICEMESLSSDNECYAKVIHIDQSSHEVEVQLTSRSPVVKQHFDMLLHSE